MALSFDELNKLYDGRRSIPYEKYFGEMELSEEDKKKRIAFSMDLELALIFIFSGIYADYRADRVVDIDFYTRSAKQRYFDVLELHNIEIDDAISEHVNEAVDSIMLTTVKTIPLKLPDDYVVPNKEPESDGGTPSSGTPEIPSEPSSATSKNKPQKPPGEKRPNLWPVSKDRARFDAEEEANTVFNRKDYINALKAGKTRKRWVTMKDDRVRKTHWNIDEVEIDIKDFFNVGGYAMLFPRDEITGGAPPEEILQCRCVLQCY